MCIICNKKRMTVNGIAKGDPTRTLTVRRRFINDLNRRFTALIKEIEEAIIKNDVFGLRSPTILQSTPRQFAFTRDSDKVRAFMDWLDIQEEKFIFSGGAGGIQRIGRQGANWTDTYIRSAYQRGIARARAELKRAGAEIPTAFGKDAGGEIIAAFNQPIHIDRAELAFTRTFRGLKTVVDRMDGEISQRLAQGLIEGRNPNEIAKSITGFIKNKSMNDARTLARTEVIRAHHSATIGEYRRAGIEGVTVKAEWFTAGDDRVCPDCQALEGQIFTLDEIEGMIPLHPNCRCIALPVV